MIWKEAGMPFGGDIMNARESVSKALGLEVFRRHIFLCVDAAEP